MIFNMSLRHYASQLPADLNQSLSLGALLAPFQLADCIAPHALTNDPSGEFLLGHLVDELFATHNPATIIDPFEVAAVAWDLGFDPAGDFLDVAPYVIYQLAKDI